MAWCLSCLRPFHPQPVPLVVEGDEDDWPAAEIEWVLERVCCMECARAALTCYGLIGPHQPEQPQPSPNGGDVVKPLTLSELRYLESDKREALRRKAAGFVLLTRSLVNDPHIADRRQEVALAFDALIAARREFDEISLRYAEAASAERYRNRPVEVV